MNTIFSTQQIHPRDRLSYWLNFSERVVKWDVRPHYGKAFYADFASESLGAIEVLLITISPVDIAHGKIHIAQSDDDLLLWRQIIGQLIMDQNNQAAIIQPGEFALLDTRLPYTGQLHSQSKILVLKIPRRELQSRIGQLANYLARPVGSSGGVDSFTSSFLELLPENLSSLSPSSRQIIGTQLLDLIALSLSMAGGRGKIRLSSSKALLLVKLRAAMAARLTETHVRVDEIANAAGISVRYANKLMANHNHSVSSALQTLRLERCKGALEDPLQAHRNISEIAFAWGFSDVTHFGRRFKKMYGLVPSQWRKTAQKHS